MARTPLALCSLLLVLVAAATVQARRAPLSEDVKTLAGGNTAFAFDLLHRLPGDETLFVSPHSLSEAMAMAYAGAGGETAAALGKGMRYGVPQARVPEAFGELRDVLVARPERSYGDPDPLVLEVANAFWADRSTPFRREYVRLLLTRFGAIARTADFRGDAEGARREINTWVSDKTRQKIEELLSPGSVGVDTALVLVNAIWFKAAWRYPFQVEATRPAPFTKVDGTAIQVPTMHLTEGFRHAEGDGWALLELPYAGSDTVMTILLPDAGALPALEARLDASTLDAMLQSARYRSVALALPRIRAQTRLEATEVLQAMGMGAAFSAGADFSGMSEAGPLFIARVIHQAMLDVDEAGTEAAAATAVVMDKGGEARPVSFRVDRPFLVLIRNTRTGAILFLGRILDPTGAV